MSIKESHDLKDQLRIIEAETDFFSRSPELSPFVHIYVVVVSLCLLTLVPKAFENGDYLVLFVLIAAGSINFLGYLQSKRLFGLYCGACEIINYYKKADEKQI